MKLKITWALCLAAGLGCVVALLVIANWPAAVTGKRGVQAERSRNQARLDVNLPVEPATAAESRPAPIPTPAESQQRLVIFEPQSAPQPQRAAAGEQTRTEPSHENSIFTDPAAKEKLGRLALSYVGADPLADEVWVWLINDPQLSAKVREDLIEDLNENGFSDGNGRRATVDDLPLIESRILLLEEQAQFAMDEVNASAFAEAYKDLANMWWRLNQ
jgi:hypothetical protein